jgi:predicted CXXCH cytochrome family protein
VAVLAAAGTPGAKGETPPAATAGAPRSAAPATGEPRKAEFTPIPLLDAAHVANPHDHEGKPLCQRCHLPGQAGVTGDPIELCTQCHNPAFMKHPHGIAAQVVPEKLPLEAGLRIVCHTCHDPHDVKARRAGLRLEYGALCLQCHTRHVQKPAGKN